MHYNEITIYALKPILLNEKKKIFFFHNVIVYFLGREHCFFSISFSLSISLSLSSERATFSVAT